MPLLLNRPKGNSEIFVQSEDTSASISQKNSEEQFHVFPSFMHKKTFFWLTLSKYLISLKILSNLEILRTFSTGYTTNAKFTQS